MTQPAQTNIVWHQHRVSVEQHEQMNGHRGAILWFTGLSGSGKSTVANAVESHLYDRGNHTYILDGDNIRHGLNKDLDFSEEGRIENIRRIGEVAHLFADAGLIVLTAFISPFRKDRSMVRTLNTDHRFIEIYCKADIALCESRDPKGLYKKARAGQIKDFTGIDSPYEPPDCPELTVDTGENNPEQCAAQVLTFLQEQSIIKTT